MMTFICVVSIALSLVQIPALALLFRRAHRLSRGQGWCYRDLQRVLLRIGAVESSLTDAREEQEKLRDRLEESFDVVIVSNALHIVPQPEKALAEIRRVLKDDGVLIAPTFTHAGNSFTGKVRAFFMKLAGFPLHSRWTSEEYLSFLRQNGWTVQKSVVLKASFPLTYTECVKSEV